LENVYILWSFGIFYGHWGYFMTNRYILYSFGTFIPDLVSCTKKNLATLNPSTFFRFIFNRRDRIIRVSISLDLIAVNADSDMKRWHGDKNFGKSFSFFCFLSRFLKGLFSDILLYSAYLGTTLWKSPRFP
jgi:hypothetical protein